MNPSIPSRARSFVSAILALTLGLSTTTFALRPMTPVENGGWMGDDCWGESNTVRSDQQCCADKCNSLYPGSGGALVDCYNICISRVNYDYKHQAIAQD